MTRLMLVVFCFASMGLPVSTHAQQPLDGRSLYMIQCAQCHGTNLQGGNAKSLVDGVWQFGEGRTYRIRNTKYGITHLGMPAFDKTLTDEQITSILDFLEQSEKEVASGKPPLPQMLQTQDYDVKVEVFADSLQIPWAIDFLDDSTALITERPGRLRLVKNGILQLVPISGTPEVLNEGQGGLMDVAIDPNFKENGWVYLSYSHVLKEAGGERPPAMTNIVRGRIKNNAWMDQQVLFEAPHNTYRTARHHYGSRIVFDPQGYLYFSIGDRGAGDQAQDIKRPNGKIHRIHTDGRIPQDNPFVAHAGAIPSIFSYGHRNPQGMAVHPMTGQVWVTEHGPMGGDELNLIHKGLNYGWPEITYGRNYNGTIITEDTHKDGMEQPSMYWKPSTAVCGLDFYRGSLFSKWRNKLLVGALKYEDVRLLNIENDRVMHEEVIVKNLGRVRDVSTGPDGAVYVVLNTPDIVLRLTPLAESRNQ